MKPEDQNSKKQDEIMVLNIPNVSPQGVLEPDVSLQEELEPGQPAAEVIVVQPNDVVPPQLELPRHDNQPPEALANQAINVVRNRPRVSIDEAKLYFSHDLNNLKTIYRSIYIKRLMYIPLYSEIASFFLNLFVSDEFKQSSYFMLHKYLLDAIFSSAQTPEGTANQINFQKFIFFSTSSVYSSISTSIQSAYPRSVYWYGLASLITFIPGNISTAILNSIFRWRFEELFLENEAERIIYKIEDENHEPLPEYDQREEHLPFADVYTVLLTTNIIDFIVRAAVPANVKDSFWFLNLNYLVSLPLLGLLLCCGDKHTWPQKFSRFSLMIMADALNNLIADNNNPDDSLYYTNGLIITPGIICLLYLMTSILERPAKNLYHGVSNACNRRGFWHRNNEGEQRLLNDDVEDPAPVAAINYRPE